MAKKEKQVEISTEKKIQGKLTIFLEKNYKTIAIVLAAIILVLVVTFVGSKIASSSADKLALKVETVTKHYNDLQGMDKNGADYNNALKVLNQEIEELEDKRGYAGAKAKYLKGLLAFNDGDYKTAGDIFYEVYSSTGKENYLSSVALTDAAVCKENLNDGATAKSYYQLVWDTWGTDAPESPKALFALARLNEAEGNKELAKATFQTIIDNYSDSEYAKLAKTRVIAL